MLFNEMYTFCLILDIAMYEINLKRHFSVHFYSENFPNNKKTNSSLQFFCVSGGNWGACIYLPMTF